MVRDVGRSGEPSLPLRGVHKGTNTEAYPALIKQEDYTLKKFLSSKQVRARYGDRSKMWLVRRLKKDPKFPRPTKLGGRDLLFDEAELEKYERECAAREAAA